MELFELSSNIQTRWASAENYDATPGEGGKINAGRKGSPCRGINPGESFVMGHAEGSGTIRRIWITIDDRCPELLRGLVLRIFWDGCSKPAVEAPLGDFFGISLGRNAAFENAWFGNPEGRSFNCRIPMPFRKGFRMTMTNESPKRCSAFYYDVNFTLGDEHRPDAGYFHAHFRRENPTVIGKDFEILPQVEGWGRFLGSTLGTIADTVSYGTTWWGEGEVKVYLDGDKDYPTLCGTGTEDYIGTGWGQGRYAQMWQGCPVADHERMQFSFYRLHGPDPIYFTSSARVTIQQIGCYHKPEMVCFLNEHPSMELIAADGRQTKLNAVAVEAGPEYGLFERQDDWCSVAYFYLDSPTSKLPVIAPYEERASGLTGDR